MRTRTQIEAEARQLELRGHQEWSERRQAHAGAVTLFHYPESVITHHSSGAGDGTEVHHLLRRIEVPVPTDRLEFRLVEEELVADAEGIQLRAYSPVDLVSADNAFEVLQAGYERLDEDRLRERIDPLAERIERAEFADVATEASIAEVEAATADMEFMPAARMRVRADAIAMLEGRLEPGDFIARTVQRQQCFATVLAMTVKQPITERIEVA